MFQQEYISDALLFVDLDTETMCLFGGKFGFLRFSKCTLGSWSVKGAKTQASFNLEGQRGKTRSHYLLVKGPEIDVRIGIISVGCCIIHTQSKQPPEPLTTGNEVSGDSQELKK